MVLGILQHDTNVTRTPTATWIPLQIKKNTNPGGVASSELLSELGTAAVPAHSGVSTEQHITLSANVSQHLMDAFPMHSQKDSARVRLIKLSTAVTNALLMLASPPDVKAAVRKKVFVLSDEQVMFFMDSGYDAFRSAGLRSDLPYLSMLMRQIQEGKVCVHTYE